MKRASLITLLLLSSLGALNSARAMDYPLPPAVQHSTDFQRTHSLHTHIKDTLYDWCGLRIDNRQMIRIIAPAVTVWDFAAEILASLCIDFKYRFDLLACGTAVPFVEQIDDRHHAQCGAAAVSRIHAVIDRNETDMVHREYVVDVAADFDVITPEAGKVF